MRRSTITATLLGVIAIYQAFAQSKVGEVVAGTIPTRPSETDNSTIVANLVTIYQANENVPGGLEMFQHPSTYIAQILKSEANTAQTATNTANVSNAVQKRTDQQTTAPANASGSTSTTSTGSVPSLLSFAVENGAVTQSVNGTTTTVQANIPNVIRAINRTKFIEFYRSEPSNVLARTLATISVSASFNTGSSSSSTTSSLSPSTFGSATVHIDLRNHRDPRNSVWVDTWNHLSNNELTTVANDVVSYDTSLKQQLPDEYSKWLNDTQTTLEKLAVKAPAAGSDIQSAMTAILSDFETLLYSGSAQKYASDYSKAIQTYSSAYASILSSISTSFLWSFEYTFVNQSSTALPKSTTQTYSIATTPPDLSSFNLILSGGNFLGIGATLTGNASTTLFTAASSALHVSAVRDYKLTFDLNLPIPPIAGSKKSTVDISGLFQDLVQEPLGQEVVVNGVSVTTRGNIWLGQGKWSIPIGTSGITIPFSITGSNRTDLIKETDVRGTFGISYNLDSLFAKQ